MDSYIYYVLQVSLTSFAPNSGAQWESLAHI